MTQPLSRNEAVRERPAPSSPESEASRSAAPWRSPPSSKLRPVVVCVMTLVISFLLGTNAHSAGTPAHKEARLEFRHTPLRIVIQSVNLYSAKPIVLAEDSVGELPFSGTVFEGQVTDWLRALAITLPIVVIEGDDRIVISMRRDTGKGGSEPH